MATNPPDAQLTINILRQAPFFVGRQNYLAKRLLNKNNQHLFVEVINHLSRNY